jgi:hypothetical protein
MSETTPGQWREWRQCCAIAKCEKATALALSSFVSNRFRHYAAHVVGETSVSVEMPDPAACFGLVEQWMSVARPVSGRRYKEWLFARAEGQRGEVRQGTIQAGASLVVRTVVRKWLVNSRPREELSLDAPVPGLDGVTFVDLVPDECAASMDDPLLRDMADSVADKVFNKMKRRTKLVMLARLARLPLYHPQLLDIFGMSKSKAANTWKEVLADIAGIVMRRWPNETAGWKVDMSMRALDALEGLLARRDSDGSIRMRLTKLARTR